MSEQLKKIVSDALVKLGLPPVDFEVFFPERLIHGDYSTNAALMLAKETGEKSNELAERIVGELKREKNDFIEKTEVASPGFINFFLSPEFFAAELNRILSSGDAYGRNQNLAGQKVMIEYTDPNPFKEFHIGHLMSNTIGEAISRLVEWRGAEVKRACYQGDVGLHVAKAIWGSVKRKAQNVKELTLAYVEGAEAYEKDEMARREIEELNKKIYERSDPTVNELYDWGKQESLAEFEKIYQRLGTKFNFYFFESESGSLGKKIVEENLGKVFERSEGAIIFRGEKHGLHTRVFINSAGLPTYEAKELGLAKLKYDRYPYDFSVVVTANEVSSYFDVLLKAMALIFPDLAKKTKHLGHGMLRLPTGKMSSRTGEVITAVELLTEINARLEDKVGEVSDAVAVGAVKYSILKQAPGKDIIFDFEKSLSLAGDSGPYLQYTYVRAKSVLVKAPSPPTSEFVPPAAVSEVERWLVRFPEVVAEAGKNYAPQRLVTYLLELAGAFNRFYDRYRIIGSPEESYRLALTAATAQVLKNGLWITGVPLLERM